LEKAINRNDDAEVNVEKNRFLPKRASMMIEMTLRSASTKVWDHD
jgi:hypothetical protein